MHLEVVNGPLILIEFHGSAMICPRAVLRY